MMKKWERKISRIEQDDEEVVESNEQSGSDSVAQNQIGMATSVPVIRSADEIDLNPEYQNRTLWSSEKGLQVNPVAPATDLPIPPLPIPARLSSDQPTQPRRSQRLGAKANQPAENPPPPSSLSPSPPPPPEPTKAKTPKTKTTTQKPSPRARTRSDPDPSYAPPPTSSGTPRPKRPRLTTMSRNEQSDSPQLIEAVALADAFYNKNGGSSASTSTSASSSTQPAVECDFICPVCKWKQVNKRLPDFRRHLKTHTRPSLDDQKQGYWCKGIKVEDVAKFNEKVKRMLENSEGRGNGKRVKIIGEDVKPYMFDGHMRIGGCGQQFSRKDALQRHMTNANLACIGYDSVLSD